MVSTTQKTLQEAEALLQRGDAKKALNLVNSIPAEEPGNAAIFNLAGKALATLKNWDAAIISLEKASKLAPENGVFLLNVAQAYKGAGALEKAIQITHHLARRNQSSKEVFFFLGELFQQKGKPIEAAKCFLKVIQLAPDHYASYVNLSSSYLRVGNFEEAKRACQVALSKDWKTAPVYGNLGAAYMGKTQIDDAIKAFTIALNKDPENDRMLSNMANIVAHSCDWVTTEKIHARACKRAREAIATNGSFVLRPFTALTINIDPLEHRKIAKHYSEHRLPKIAEDVGKPSKSISDRNKIVVAYLSSDVKNHPVFHLAKNLFKWHDSSRFHTICYSCGPDDGSEYRHHVVDTCDQFVDIRTMSTIDVVKKVKEDHVDILVDMNGHTMSARLDILASKPAPIAIHFLGYPGTLGSSFVDYFVTDRYLTPPGSEAHFSEKLIFMPDTYQISDDEQASSRSRIDRSEESLPEESFVFCSFNSSYKIDEPIFRCWMDILKKVPGSVLWLMSASQTATNNLQAAASRFGVDTERIVFAKNRPKAEHLARHILADLFLDTSTVCGHTTANDALQMGLPVIALPRDTFISRVSATLLRAHGLEELICKDLNEYVDLAVSLAKDEKRLSRLSADLRENGPKVPARNTKRFVRNLEKAYKRAIELLDKGEAPQHIDVSKLETD